MISYKKESTRMKKSPFLGLVISVQIAFVMLYIHKASQCMNESYHKQKLETRVKDLIHTKQLLAHKIQREKSQTEITHFAKNTLQMTPISLSQIQKVPTS